VLKNTHAFSRTVRTVSELRAPREGTVRARNPAVYVEWNCFASGASPCPRNTHAYNGTVSRFWEDHGTQDKDSDSRAEID